MVLNLVRNGIDAAAAPDGSQPAIVRLYAESANGVVRVCVEDSGSGVAASEREAVFEPFHTSKPHGMGLGLAICRTIIANHVRAMKGGAVDFLSKPFDAETLAQRIREALRADAERHTARNELAAIQARTAKLTPREREVLERVAADQANKRVAFDLGVSERTVEIHRSHVMQKMGARHLADLVPMKLLLDRG